MHINFLHLALEPDHISLTDDSGDVRIGEFRSACEAEGTDKHSLHIDDKPEYQAPEDGFSLASDIYSIGIIMLEMATGRLPNLKEMSVKEMPAAQRVSLIDAIVKTIEDPAQRELISSALHEEPSKRPVAEDLLEQIIVLAPSSVMASQFRAQVFASLRFNDDGPSAEAKQLRSKLAIHGVHLHIISAKPGESIDDAVFGTMANCNAFLAMATKDVRAPCARHSCGPIRVFLREHGVSPL